MTTLAPSLVKAQKKYAKSLSGRLINLHKERDSDLIQAIDNDPKPLATLIKELLRQHYQLEIKQE